MERPDFTVLEEHEHHIVVETVHADNPFLTTLLTTWSGAVPEGGLELLGDNKVSLHWSRSREQLLEDLRNACSFCSKYGYPEPDEA